MLHVKVSVVAVTIIILLVLSIFLPIAIMNELKYMKQKEELEMKQKEEEKIDDEPEQYYTDASTSYMLSGTFNAFTAKPFKNRLNYYY